MSQEFINMLGEFKRYERMKIRLMIVAGVIFVPLGSFTFLLSDRYQIVSLVLFSIIMCIYFVATKIRYRKIDKFFSTYPIRPKSKKQIYKYLESQLYEKTTKEKVHEIYEGLVNL